MIHGISSDLSSFQALKFKPGLNILLADKTEKSSDTDSRNGVGKTSFVELVHFLLGASVPKESIFRRDELVQSSFSLAFQGKDKSIEVTRNGTKPNSIILSDIYDLELNAIDPKNFSSSRKISNRKWSDSLGKMWFDLPVQVKQTSSYPRLLKVAANKKRKFGQILSYFCEKYNSSVATNYRLSPFSII